MSNESNHAKQTADQQASLMQEQKLKKITIWLFAVGTAAAICLVFFFCTLFRIRSSREIPEVFNAQQLGATDNSILLSWDSTGPADGYRIRMTNDNGAAVVSDCDLPFAVLRDLQPNREYSVNVCAVKDGQEYGGETVVCSTERFCEITNVTVTKVGSDYVNLSWEYEGVNEGFQTVAYVLDTNGRRHLTSDIIEIAANDKPQCTISGLASEMNYTVAVMPLTRYGKLGKSTFHTEKYSDKYNAFNIIRFVICSANVTDALQVHDLTNLKPSAHYKTSLILNGKTDQNHTVFLSLLITDTDGNLVKEEQYGDIHTNPEGKQWYIHRSMLFDFHAPDRTGEYYMYLMADEQSIYRIKFTVII